MSPSQSATGVPTLSVLEINTQIQQCLKSTFPSEVWVRGEIQGLNNRRRGPHTYFELVEKESGAAEPSAIIAAAIFKNARPTVDRRLAEQPGVELADGVEVRVRGRVDYYPPYGKLRLIVNDIDPSFTLGKVAAERERVVNLLRDEGLLVRNGALPMPVLPLHIGLVTSVESAAYRDLMDEFAQSGIGFRVTVVDARVQGAQAVPMVVSALRTLARRRVDIVIVSRGGGARTDLAGFDAEAIARAIAAMPIPVFTGIGHEIDISVADLVAARSFKTPTATAAAVVAIVREFIDGIDERWRRTIDAAASHCAEAATSQQSVSHRIVHSARRRLDSATSELRHRSGGAKMFASAGIDRAVVASDHAERLVAASDPARLLARGWSITRAADGSLIRNVADAVPGRRLQTTVADGAFESTVEASHERKDGSAQ